MKCKRLSSVCPGIWMADWGKGRRKCYFWAKELEERLGLPVHHVDERLTTLQAERVLLEADVSRGSADK